MTQTWDPQAYGQNGAFVHTLASGVLEWLAASPGEYILIWAVETDSSPGASPQRERPCSVSTPLPEMIASARERGIEVERANAELLPFGPATFDAVFSNAALHWVRDQDAMLTHVRRVLKPGGRFVAEMGGHGNIAAIRVALMAVLDRHGVGDREDGVNYYPTPESYTQRLTRHGFQVQQIALIPRPTPLPESGMAGWLRTFRRGVL